MAIGDERSGWTEVELPAPAMRRVAEARGVNPIRTYVTEFDTNDPVQREAFIRYLLNPLPVLTGQLSQDQKSEDDVAEALSRLAVDGVADHWRVVTVLRNHHRGLNPRVNFASITVSEEEETMYQEIYKQLE
ncbi:MAG TPA: hypothetical protein VMS74_13175 [Acidimicrobiia bacterium]|nr:hypothetical protein [Acidimicrobiia bacterium]